MEESALKQTNEVEDEKNPKTIPSQPVSPRKTSTDSESEPIPEIQDIYDHIYGNVKNKLVFYENKRTRTVSEESKPHSNSRSMTPENVLDGSTTPLSSIETPIPELGQKFSFDLPEAQRNQSISTLNPRELTISLEKAKSLHMEMSQTTNSSSTTESIPTHDNSTSLPEEANGTKSGLESPSNSTIESSTEESTPTVSKSCPHVTSSLTELNLNAVTHNASCSKCEKQNFILDRTEILTEINANLKADYEKIKQKLKFEIQKNNSLNFEIANIESIFETYYKEASQQKSSFALLYSVMKSYVADTTTNESYTFQRIKGIANYIENLKNKFIHQDRIIKNNFIENPYYSDLMIKHDAIIKQLDTLSFENKQLIDDKKKKEQEELEAIKELNRQKFLLENKYQEMEVFYKEKVVYCELKISNLQEEHKKQVKDFEELLKQKEEESLKVQSGYEAKISNYNRELLMLYGKLNKTKLENQT